MDDKSIEQLGLFENDILSLQSEELDKEYFELFSWALPTAFSVPLGLCWFEAGDSIYDTSKAYQSTWSKALDYVKYCIHVTYPSRSFRTEITETDDSAFESNWRSPLEIDLYTYENREIKNKENIKITQGKMYYFLWKGDFQILRSEKNPPVPIKVTSLTKILKKQLHDIIIGVMMLPKNYGDFKVKLFEELKINYNYYVAMLADVRIKAIVDGKEFANCYNSYYANIKDIPSKSMFKKEFQSEYNSNIENIKNKLLHEISSNHKYTECLIMLYDKTDPILKNKYSSIVNNLKKQTTNQIITLFCRLKKDKYKEYAPTLHVVCILSNSKDKEKKSSLYDIVKKTVYNAGKGKSNSKDQFKIEAHGIYLSNV